METDGHTYSEKGGRDEATGRGNQVVFENFLLVLCFCIGVRKGLRGEGVFINNLITRIMVAKKYHQRELLT